MEQAHSLDDYFRLEADSLEKHEFRDGSILSMAGGSLEHSRTTTNVIGELRNRLKGSACSVFDSNLRIQMARQRLYSYPDVTVICGEPIKSDLDRTGQTIANPRLVVEILSPSTANFDRTTKFDRLTELGSFQEYVLIEQNEPRVETRFRHADGTWRLDFSLGIESSIKLASLSTEISLVEIYSGVTFL